MTASVLVAMGQDAKLGMGVVAARRVLTEAEKVDRAFEKEETNMSAAKEEARKLIENIPDSASWDDIMYEFYVRKKIEIGLEEGDAGKVVSQEEVEKRFRPE